MRGKKLAALLLSSVLPTASVVAWPGAMAHAASITSTVTSGRLNQGLPAGTAYALLGSTGPVTGASGSPAPVSVSSYVTGILNQSPSVGGVFLSSAGPVPVSGQPSGQVVTSGGVTTGRLGTGLGVLPPVLPSGLGVPPLQGSSAAPQVGGGQPPTAGTGSAPGTAPAAGQNDQSYVLSLVNEQRLHVAAQPLALDDALTALAQERAQALAANHVVTHDVPGYGYPDAMEMAAGIKGRLLGAEDIATGKTLYQAFWMLMTSDWHRANLLFPSYDTAGIGIAPMSDGNLVLDILFIER